jgi:hypothetical protein
MSATNLGWIINCDGIRPAGTVKFFSDDPNYTTFADPETGMNRRDIHCWANSGSGMMSESTEAPHRYLAERIARNDIPGETSPGPRDVPVELTPLCLARRPRPPPSGPYAPTVNPGDVNQRNPKKPSTPSPSTVGCRDMRDPWPGSPRLSMPSAPN